MFVGKLCLVLLPCAAILACGEFLPNRSDYDEAEARMFASLSSVTYCDNTESVLNWSCTTCKDSKTPLAIGKIKIVDAGLDNATRVLVGKLRDQHGCLVSFRGSDNLVNWMRNFQFWAVKPRTFEHCAGCEVHGGFYDIWKNIQNFVIADLQEVGCSTSGSDPDNILYVTGHSLGGALSHLAMFTFENLGFKIAKSYSFEAPRVGNLAFSEDFANRFTSKFPLFRVTHAQDPVVHLPPEFIGYVHVQTEVFYDSKGKHILCDKVEDASCADQYKDLPLMLLLHTNDHCGSPLVPNGNLCYPEGCGTSAHLVV